ncbi:MAG: oligosaccharide flippase family protein [Lachnospiraceae bacterium]|nr:oligosaccharide flippase family protein [Lachnospiraceae bacterium]
MRKTGNALKAGVWYIISNFISKSILYICTPLYTRLLTTAEYGQYSNFISWQSMLAAFVTFDLSSSVGIAYIDFKSDLEFHEFISTISVCSVLIPMLFSLPVLLYLDEFVTIFDLDKTHLFILLFYLCCCNTLQIYQAEQRSKIRYKLSSTLTLLVSCGGVALTLILVLCLQDNLMGIILGNILFNVVVNIGILRAILKKTMVIRWKYARYGLLISIPLIPHILAGTILGSSDKVMITKMCGSEKTALYSLVFTIAMIITMFASSINKAWVPWFFDRLSNGDDISIKNAVRKIFPLLSISAFLICLTAPEIVWILGGKNYLEAVQLIPPLILHCVCNFVSTLYINIEFYTKKTFGISVITVISSVINLLLNWIFIRGFGYGAAAYTTLFSSVLTLIFHLYKIKKQKMLRIFDNKYNFAALIVTFAACLLTLCIYPLAMVRYCLMIGIIVVGCVLICKNKRRIYEIFMR